MPERFMRGIEAVNGIVWGPMGLGLLFGTGLLLTVRTGCFQLRRWGYWMRHTLGAILTDRSVTAHTAREEQAISQFQSLCTALASTIGTGNLVGVATAILSGGAGAVFWMWMRRPGQQNWKTPMSAMPARTPAGCAVCPRHFPTPAHRNRFTHSM